MSEEFIYGKNGSKYFVDYKNNEKLHHCASYLQK